MYRTPAIFPRILVIRHRLGKIEVVGTFDGPEAKEKATNFKNRIAPGAKPEDRFEILTGAEYTSRTSFVW